MFKPDVLWKSRWGAGDGVAVSGRETGAITIIGGEGLVRRVMDEVCGGCINNDKMGWYIQIRGGSAAVVCRSANFRKRECQKPGMPAAGRRRPDENGVGGPLTEDTAERWWRGE